MRQEVDSQLPEAGNEEWLIKERVLGWGADENFLKLYRSDGCTIL